jgi:hypothetical protein
MEEGRQWRTMWMQSGVACPVCSAIMPPERDLCENCEAMEEAILHHQQQQQQ